MAPPSARIDSVLRGVRVFDRPNKDTDRLRTVHHFYRARKYANLERWLFPMLYFYRSSIAAILTVICQIVADAEESIHPHWTKSTQNKAFCVFCFLGEKITEKKTSESATCKITFKILKCVLSRQSPILPIGPVGSNLGEGELWTPLRSEKLLISRGEIDCTFSEKIKHKMQRELVQEETIFTYTQEYLYIKCNDVRKYNKFRSKRREEGKKRKKHRKNEGVEETIKTHSRRRNITKKTKL